MYVIILMYLEYIIFTASVPAAYLNPDDLVGVFLGSFPPCTHLNVLD